MALLPCRTSSTFSEKSATKKISNLLRSSGIEILGKLTIDKC